MTSVKSLNKTENLQKRGLRIMLKVLMASI